MPKRIFWNSLARKTSLEGMSLKDQVMVHGKILEKNHLKIFKENYGVK